MAYAEWNDGMSVNVAAIDTQHQALLSMINELHEAMTQGQGTTVLGEIIDGLIEYTRSHFATEEAYFEACGYPDCVAHKDEHREFVANVMDFKRGFEEGRLMLTLDVMSFLGDWLVGHILRSDAAYARYVAREGVQ